MLYNVGFHYGLHCLLRQERSSEKQIQFYLEIITCDPSIYTINLMVDCIKPEGRIDLYIKGLSPNKFEDDMLQILCDKFKG